MRDCCGTVGVTTYSTVASTSAATHGADDPELAAARHPDSCSHRRRQRTTSGGLGLGRQPRWVGDVRATLARKNRARGSHSSGRAVSGGPRRPGATAAEFLGCGTELVGDGEPASGGTLSPRGGKEDHGAKVVESGGGARRGPAAGRRRRGGVKSGGGGSSYGAAARHVSKAEVETTPLSSFLPVPALSSFPLAPPLSSFPPACRREGLATVSARGAQEGGGAGHCLC
jgi:hypothetical protein